MKGLFLWQWDDIAERSVDEVAQTLRVGGCDTLLVKANDGSAWMSRFDRSPLALGSIKDVEQRRQALADLGVRMVPWGNPRCPGVTEDVESLARMTASIARAAGAYDYDVEPGPMYWRSLPELAGAERFFGRVRELAPSARLVLDFPGSWAWSYGIAELIRVAEPYLDGFEIQSYFPTSTAARDEARLRGLTDKPICHIAYYTRVREFVDWALGRGSGDLLVWDFAHMDPSAYAQLARIPRVQEPSPVAAQPFAIGEGIAAAMRERGDRPLTHEGRPELPYERWALGASGAVYFYDADTNRVSVAP